MTKLSAEKNCLRDDQTKGMEVSEMVEDGGQLAGDDTQGHEERLRHDLARVVRVKNGCAIL